MLNLSVKVKTFRKNVAKIRKNRKSKGECIWNTFYLKIVSPFLYPTLGVQF